MMTEKHVHFLPAARSHDEALRLAVIERHEFALIRWVDVSDTSSSFPRFLALPDYHCWACCDTGKVMQPNPRRSYVWESETCYVCLGASAEGKR